MSSNKINVELKAGSGGETYVVEGAKLTCSLGGKANSLRIPDDRRISINGRKQANIGDHGGGKNIMSFGPCSRSTPPPPCIMSTGMKWVNGKGNVLVEGEPALLDTSVNLCACGGVIRIANDGQ